MHSSRMCTIHCGGRLSCHACPLSTHSPLPCMPPATCAPCHAHPLPCMPPPPATHASCHACPLQYMPPGMCVRPLPRMPLLPCMLRSPSVDRTTDACENITFLQLPFRMVTNEGVNVYITGWLARCKTPWCHNVISLA